MQAEKLLLPGGTVRAAPSLAQRSKLRSALAAASVCIFLLVRLDHRVAREPPSGLNLLVHKLKPGHAPTRSA